MESDKTKDIAISKDFKISIINLDGSMEDFEDK